MRYIMSVARDGVVHIKKKCVDGCIQVAEGKKSSLEKCLVICRLSYDGKTSLVNGIPEADSSDKAVDALVEFDKQVNRQLQGLNPWTGEEIK